MDVSIGKTLFEKRNFILIENEKLIENIKRIQLKKKIALNTSEENRCSKQIEDLYKIILKNEDEANNIFSELVKNFIENTPISSNIANNKIA